MKNRKKLFIISAIALILGSLIFVKCKQIGDPTDGLKLIINYNVIKTTLSVTFLDGATGDPIGYNDGRIVNVVVNGEDADKILDVTGAAKSSFTSASGFLGFGLDPAFTPSTTNPINFTIVAECNGYASTSKPVAIYMESNQSIIITMVDLNNLPNGVTRVFDNSIFVSDSVVDDEVVVTTPTAGTTGTKAQLTIPQGTKIMDANGNILTGVLNTNIVYYNNIDDQALAAFPGGLTALVNLNGNNENVMFYSGGFASIEIADASGVKAKTFQYSEPQLMIEMSSNTYNKNTGAHVEDQDTVPLWSYDLESGNWKLDEWTLVEDNGGVLQATSGLSHLSFFNLDWWWPYSGPSIIGAFLRFFYFVKDAGVDPETVALEITIRKKDDNTFINRYVIEAPIEEDYPIGGWGLGNVPVILEIRSLCDLTNSQFVEIIDPSQGVYPITLQNIQSTAQSISVSFEGYCPNNPDIIIRPTTPFVYRDECSGGNWIWAYMVDGLVTLHNMELNHLYRVGVYYDGEFHEEGFEFDNTNQSYQIEFTQEVCDIVGQ